MRRNYGVHQHKNNFGDENYDFEEDTYDNCEDFIGDDKNECIGVGEYDDEDEHFQKGKLFIGS